MYPWLAASIAAAMLSGCGGSSAARTGAPVTNQTGAPVASESDLRAPATARADAICRRLDAELVANLPKSVNARVIASVSPRNAVLEQKAVSELAKLEPPKGSEQAWQQVISYRRMLAQALSELARAAKAGDQAAIKRLGQYKQTVRNKLLAAGERVGFSSCQKLG